MERLTIHRALAELKLIGARITKGIEELNPSGTQQKDKLVNRLFSREEFEKRAREKFQSVLDLIERRNKIKSAIVQANATTMVTIAGKTMTIADAINLKNTIAAKQELAATLRKKHTLAKATMEKGNAEVDAAALRLAEVALGKQGIKIGEDDVQKVVGPYLEQNKYVLVDPLEVDKQVDVLTEDVNAFATEVDATLSEINATTFIEL